MLFTSDNVDGSQFDRHWNFTTLDDLVTNGGSQNCESLQSYSNSNCTDRLFRKLVNCEATITELMSLGRSSGILKEKLAVIDDLILDIADHSLAEEWRLKVATWWRQFATISATSVSSVSSDEALSHHHLQNTYPWAHIWSSPSKNGTSSVNGDTWPTVTSHNCCPASPSISYTNIASMRPLQAPIGTGSGGGCATLAEVINNHNHQFCEVMVTNKETIRAQLETAFEQVAVIRDDGTMDGDSLVIGSSSTATYIDGMQRLLASVARTIKAFIPFISDDKLLLDVSALAIAKLPVAKQIEFNGRYERKSLFNLMRFLRKEIVLYYEKFNTLNGQQQQEAIGAPEYIGGDELCPPVSDDTQWAQLLPPPYCVYCRKTGHKVHQCFVKKSMLCFKCYTFGHTLKCCPNPTLINIK